MEYSKTPWRIEPATRKDNWRIVAFNGQVVSTFSGNMDMDNARRIVACVNACAGIPQDDVEELAEFGVMELTVYADDMRQQRDELLTVLERIIGAYDACAADDNKSLVDEFTEEMEASARAVIQKVRGGE